MLAPYCSAGALLLLAAEVRTQRPSLNVRPSYATLRMGVANSCKVEILIGDHTLTCG